MSIQPLQISSPIFIESVVKNESSTVKGSKSSDTAALDHLTGGAFSAPTSGERASRIRDWLATQPSVELMADVYKELSHRDKGAAKGLKEKLDELRRQKAQESIAAEWAEKAQVLLSQTRLNVGDAMAWQRDAAKAGAPLSREPLSQLKQALTERLKAIEDLQTQVQIAREGAVLLAQRIEVLSTKPLQDSVAVREGLCADVERWTQQAQALTTEAQWNSIDLRFGTMLETSKTQLKQVWEAFDAALTQAQTALTDTSATLPAVPVWADEIREARGETTAEKAAANEAENLARRHEAASVVKEAVAHLAKELEQGHSKAMQRLIGELRAALKEHGRWLATDIETQAQALLTQAGDLEGWQRWRADQLREELIGKAEQLTQGAETQRMGGRKMQEALRTLREQWKLTDQGGVPNHALWKRFDEACTQAHKVVEAWLEKVKAESAAHRAQRLALVQAVNDWTVAHQGQTDWKAQVRELSQFADQWRNAGHLSEKQFAELQPLWKQAMTEARAFLEQAQAASLARREALIARAQELGAAPVLRLDAVRGLQQEWQQEAQSVPLDRRHEQKLWEAFRKPIDEAFERKTAEREKQTAALNAHDQRVVTAAKALEEAVASQDAQRIQAAMQALEQAARGQEDAAASASASAATAQADVPSTDAVPASAAEEGENKPATTSRRPLIAVRGDDRPGQKKTEVAVPAKGARTGDRRDVRSGRDGDRGGDRPHRDGRDREGREERTPRGPRLGDAAFRAQRDAIEQAQLALKKLASQAHGQVLTQIMDAWKDRDANRLPAPAELGSKVNAATRALWVKALSTETSQTQGAAELLRLEMAAEVPTPAAHLDARRALQLQLLTRRNDPAPAQTWGADVAKVLSGAWSDEAAQRLQQALKPLVRR